MAITRQARARVEQHVNQARPQLPLDARSCPAYRSISLPRRDSASVSVTGWPRRSLIFKTPATSWGTSAPSERPASGTSHTPSEYAPTSSRATSRASRVLPEPPAPVRVRSRVIARARLTSTSSCSRPMKLVLTAGRLCQRPRVFCRCSKNTLFGRQRPSWEVYGIAKPPWGRAPGLAPIPHHSSNRPVALFVRDDLASTSGSRRSATTTRHVPAASLPWTSLDTRSPPRVSRSVSFRRRAPKISRVLAGVVLPPRRSDDR